MARLMELLAKSHRSAEGGEKHKEHRKEGGKTHRKEKGKEGGEKKEKHPSKFKYPEMKLNEVETKKSAGYSFKAATQDDLKDEAKEKLMITIKLPKMGFTPFVMSPPVDVKDTLTDTTNTKPMNVVGDPTPKADENPSTKVESHKKSSKIKT